MGPMEADTIANSVWLLTLNWVLIVGRTHNIYGRISQAENRQDRSDSILWFNFRPTQLASRTDRVLHIKRYSISCHQLPNVSSNSRLESYPSQLLLVTAAKMRTTYQVAGFHPDLHVTICAWTGVQSPTTSLNTVAFLGQNTPTSRLYFLLTIY